MNNAAKHHWYDDTSPWTEQLEEDYYSLKGPQSRPSASKVVILDRENPPQWRSGRDLEN